MATITQTPTMKQYAEMKKKYPDAVLLFRVGDFYETFSDDAITASEILGITLTRRANGQASHVELAGFPHHALDTYLPRLVRAGKRVAICEQLENPKLTKERGITEIVTPYSSLCNNSKIETLSLQPFISLLRALTEVVNKLSLLDEIRFHTKEIHRISNECGIAPITAFTRCFEFEQLKLF